MDFRLRVMGMMALLSALVGLSIGGLLFSPERRQARAAARQLLPIASPGEITAMDFVIPGSPQVELRRNGGGWEAVTGERTLPASFERAEAFAKLLVGLSRGALVSRDPSRAAALGLGEDRARLIIIRRSGGRQDIGLLVGARAPSGDEDFAMVQGDPAVFLVRGILSILLSQDNAYWYELSLFPRDVTGASVVRIDTRGSLDLGGDAGGLTLGYALIRGPQGAWALQGNAQGIDGLAASSMAEAIARLEGDDFVEAGAALGSAQGNALTVEVRTREGKTYSLTARRAGGQDKLLVTTSWSPWTYGVSPTLFRRAIRPVSELTVR